MRSASGELRRMFGRATLPRIGLTLEEVGAEARRLAGRMSISGVQPKLSMTLRGGELVPVAEEGLFILKPQSPGFPELPENEALCMELAAAWGIQTARCALLELRDGSRALVVRRFDRERRGRRLVRLRCEHLQQILGEDKYAGSHEALAKAIAGHCTFPRVELRRFYDLALFNFAVGNGDAHKKNFSLLTRGRDTALAPAYDLVSSRLVIPDEDAELALTLNGRRNRLGRGDFMAFAAAIGIPAELAAERVDSLVAALPAMLERVAGSQLSAERRERLAAIAAGRVARLARE